MRIAYIVPYVPNQIRTRSYNLIAHLAELGHEVDVFTIGSNSSDREDAESLRSKCTRVVYHHQPLGRSLANAAGAVFTGQPLQSVYSWQPELLKEFERIAARKGGTAYDVIHVEHLRGSRYGVELKARFPDQPVVWDSVDCISHLFKQASSESSDLFGKLITRFELERTRRMEGALLGCFDHVLVTSSIDREALLSLNPNGKQPGPISVLSNGVDQVFFHPNSEIQRDPETLVFSGKMSYHANISMVKYLVADIMPRIWNKRPGTRLLIVGKDPSAEVRELEKNPLIQVTGTVSDIRPFLWRATVSVVPLLYGAGIQNKILEAMATNTPVVTTFKSLKALQVQEGKELLAAHDAEGFSRAVLRLIEDRQLQKSISDAGASYVAANHNWSSIATWLVSIYEQAIDRPSRTFQY